MSESLFGHLLKQSFNELPPAIRKVHDARSKCLRGKGDVTRGAHWLVKWLAPFASLPPTSNNIPIAVEIVVHPQGETWSRSFNGHLMQSHLRAAEPLLAERLGAMTLFFRLHGDANGIHWHVAGAKCLGVPLPTKWFTGAVAREQILNERYSFDVRAALPIVGLLVHYRGWLSE
jgi:Domain of unknown function (DUF4166)